MQRAFKMQIIYLFLMIFPRMSLHCKLVPVQYREYTKMANLTPIPNEAPRINLQRQESYLSLFITYTCTAE